MTEPLKSNAAGAPRHPMRLVAARTGLSPHVLRVWERRYGAVQPQRTEGGQRLYSDADIERLELLKRAADAGRNIGQLVDLPEDALRALVAADGERGGPGVASTPAPVPAPDDLAASGTAILARCFDAVRELAPDHLEIELRRSMILLPLAQFADEVLAPLLHGIGKQWMEGHLGPAQEHVATVVIRRLLEDIIRSCEPAPAAATLVVGTPAGQRHELGALLAAAIASAAGWHVIYLGLDLPASEILQAAEIASARAIALSVVHPAHDEHLRAELETLAAALPPGRVLVLGGAAAQPYARKLRRSGVYAISSLGGFRELLTQLEAQPPA